MNESQFMYWVPFLLIIPVLIGIGVIVDMIRDAEKKRKTHFTDQDGRIIATIEYSYSRGAWTWDWRSFYLSKEEACKAYKSQTAKAREIEELERMMND